MIGGDEVNVSIDVAVEPAEAFRLFTEDIDLWWKSDPAYRVAKTSLLKFEPYAGGRFLDIHEARGTVREVGKVLVWQPPLRLVFEWRGINFEGGDNTEVEVNFSRLDTGTRVRLCHRGWSTLAKEHPVRHGVDTQQFIANMSDWWAKLLEAYLRQQLRQQRRQQR